MKGLFFGAGMDARLKQMRAADLERELVALRQQIKSLRAQGHSYQCRCGITEEAVDGADEEGEA